MSIEILKTFIWAGTTIVSVLIVALIFRTAIINFLKKTKKFSFEGVGIKMKSEAIEVQQKEEILQKESGSLLMDHTKIFRKETFDLFRSFVINETNYDKLSTDKEKFEVLLHYSIVLYIIRDFDRIYDGIFGSQIALLQFLSSKGPQDFKIFEYYYNQGVEKSEGRLKTMPLETYPRFLYSFRVIFNNQDQKVDISILGIDFLKYIVETKRDLFKDF